MIDKESYISFYETLPEKELGRILSTLARDIQRIGKLYEDIGAEYELKKTLYDCVNVALRNKEWSCALSYPQKEKMDEEGN